jgi:UTP:GlnB (protein PII) uridylyltransferase
MTTSAAPEWIDDFAGSMPASYRDRHSRDTIAVHAGIAAGRGSSPANLGRFDSPQGKAVVCVVAEDRPGLLSRITAAFVMQGWDIVHAEAYTRPLPSADGAPDSALKTEAVDLFWLRRSASYAGAPEPQRSVAFAGATEPQRSASYAGATEPQRERTLSSGDVDAIKETLIGLLEGRLELPETVAADEPGEIHNTRVRFIEGEDGTLCTLEVETRDRSGLLLVLTRALVAQRVTITRSEVRTFSTRVFDRFTIAEFDGSPISEARRLQIQVGVLSAIETPWSVPELKRPARERRANAR